MPASIKITLDKSYSLRQPDETELGRSIISTSIDLIYKKGFEDFNFKKVADKIKTSEASVYRYFKNKYQLLHYLVAWYWTWLEFTLTFKTLNLTDPQEKMAVLIRVLTEADTIDPNVPFVNEHLLHFIAVTEGPKIFYSNTTDKNKKYDSVKVYGQFLMQVTKIIKDYAPKYRHPLFLAKMIVSTTHRLVYDDINHAKKTKNDIHRFMEETINSVLK